MQKNEIDQPPTGRLSHPIPGMARFFCNDAGETSTSHFSTKSFYKRHLDKKLFTSGFLVDRVDDTLVVVTELLLGI
jgi:hypothetical protein